MSSNESWSKGIFKRCISLRTRFSGFSNGIYRLSDTYPLVDILCFVLGFHGREPFLVVKEDRDLGRVDIVSTGDESDHAEGYILIGVGRLWVGGAQSSG